ncbi:MAG: hypothetical protein ACI4WS_08860 [Oscillospiraceae bacterium]
MKKCPAIMATLLLCAVITGCQNNAAQTAGSDSSGVTTTNPTTSEIAPEATDEVSVAEPAVTSAVESKPETAEEAPPENSSRALAEKLEGVYLLNGYRQNQLVAKVDCLGGVMLVEYAELYDGSPEAYWCQEIAPEDNAALFDEAALSFTGTGTYFSVYFNGAEYTGAPYETVVSITEEELSVACGTNTNSFERTSDEGWFHTAPEMLYQELSQWYTLGYDSEVVGMWFCSGDGMDIFLELNADGSMVYAKKTADVPIEYYTGAWGIDPDGDIRVFIEQAGDTTSFRQEYAFSYSLTDGKLCLDNSSEGTLLPKRLEMSPAPQGQRFSEGLFAGRNDILKYNLYYQIKYYGYTDGKEILDTGENVELYGEKCRIFHVGADNGSGFVSDYTFAVSPTIAVYQYIEAFDSWQGFNELAKIYAGSEQDTLFAVFYDNRTPEYQFVLNSCSSDIGWYSGETTAVVLPLYSGMKISLEKVAVDFNTGDISVSEVCGSMDNTQRSGAFTADVNITETIPEYRITAEYNGQTAVWYATYDGRYENGIAYVNIQEE